MDPETLAETCGDDPSWICREVLEATDGNEFLARTADFLLARPLQILLILLIAFVANRLVRRGIRHLTEEIAQGHRSGALKALRDRAPSVLVATSEHNLRSAARAETIGQVLRSVATAIVYGIASLLILGELGINLGPLLAGAGIAGVALGFGAQSLVKDFLSGTFMLLEDQYGVGDIVDVGEAIGVVEAVSLRSTRVRDLAGTMWHVPNGEIRRVGNMSQQWARALIDVQVAYGTDVAHAQTVIKEVADTLWHEPEWRTRILEEPEVWGVEELGADGVAIRLVIKTRPAEQWGIMRELRGRLKERFDAEGIEIPFPQRTLWMKAEQADKPSRPPRKRASPRKRA